MTDNLNGKTEIRNSECGNKYHFYILKNPIIHSIFILAIIQNYKPILNPQKQDHLNIKVDSLII